MERTPESIATLPPFVPIEGQKHKVRTYKEYHSVCPSSELGLSQPLSRLRVFPSPQKQGGGGTLACEWGVGGESQFRRGAYTVVLFICTYFVDKSGLTRFPDFATVAAAADSVADTADTAADMLPATVAVLGAGVAVAAVAVGTNRPCPMRPSVWMQHRVISTSIFLFFCFEFAPRLVLFFFMS